MQPRGSGAAQGSGGWGVTARPAPKAWRGSNPGGHVQLTQRGSCQHRPSPAPRDGAGTSLRVRGCLLMPLPWWGESRVTPGYPRSVWESKHLILQRSPFPSAGQKPFSSRWRDFEQGSSVSERGFEEVSRSGPPSSNRKVPWAAERPTVFKIACSEGEVFFHRLSSSFSRTF